MPRNADFQALLPSAAKLVRTGSRPAQNSLSATIDRIEDDTPATTLLLLDCGGQRLLARVTRRAVSRLGLAPGKAVFAQVKTAAVRKAVGPASVPVPA